MISHGIEKRRQAYDLWRTGIKKSVIARELEVDYDTLLVWTKRFSKEGESGLDLRYQNCGLRSLADAPIRARAIELRQTHKDWGAEYIRLHLEREFPGQKIVQPNQIRHWISKAGLVAKKTKLPSTTSAEWANKPLQRVQVDANEQLRTADGKPCCYLNFIDECTGSELDAFVFPLWPYQPSARH